jgi:hypothetical protein
MSIPQRAQSDAEVYQIVRDAILYKKIIKATYNGYVREMCPHVLGLNKQHAEQALLYQFGGGSSTGIGPAGSPDNWRCVLLSKLKDVSSEPGQWRSAANHSRPQTCVAKVDVEVEF